MKAGHTPNEDDPNQEEGRVYIRRFKRYGVDKRIRVVSAGKILNGRCHVLSEGGFGAVIAGKLPEQSIVNIEFAMDTESKKMLSMAAEVRFAQGFHYGLEFVAPNPKQKEMICELFAESVQIG